MPIADVSPGVSIAYETFGDPGDPAVLLVMGLGAQMLGWDEALCQELAGRGRYVIRYDNRDCGLSTRFDEHPVDVGQFMALVGAGEIAAASALVPYTIQEMADDGLNLLTALGIERAHVVGSSVGGMLAQVMAISRPERVLTLTSMMSSTGEPQYGKATPEAQAAIAAPRPADREGFIAAAERDLMWASRRYGDPAVLRDLAARSYDRAYYPAGVGRQLGAVTLGGSRADALRELKVPTLVIHGLDDTLIDPSGGKRTAELVPGAKLLLLPDMGHDRPRPLWPQLIGAIEAHTA
ncbi:pimeloyl-ACP methyl ester carboxylesterase [Kitasatospora sp. GP30]|uniref:alpha/beta fold hydrolase n=1 Tax=Kitasatospora sp. GP30 TaxID=3035084 RepID=UPI000C70527C|nr:alpha/beta hydrolase [Kitasatospora sp. GP30]MDH6138073.1 pimeloyl-ACP methyl ester carboxylesterase [Kitasatospora sp. GP30]